VQGQLAVDRGRVVALEHQLALVGRGRELGDVEHLRLLGVLVQLVVAEVDAGGVDGDVDAAGLGRAVHDDAAFGLVELAAPDRQAAEVVGFEARVGVARVDLVGVGGEGAACADGGQQGDAEVLQFHETVPLG
jgi:hypothetical protein